MEKKEEILIEQKRQNKLKEEIQKLKKKLPSIIIGFIFFIAVSLYFLEDKFYHFFGNNANFIFTAVIILVVFSIFLILTSSFKIRKKEKEINEIGIKLYKLQKLEVEPKNE